MLSGFVSVFVALILRLGEGELLLHAAGTRRMGRGMGSANRGWWIDVNSLGGEALRPGGDRAGERTLVASLRN